MVKTIPKPIRYLLIQLFYYIGEFCLWAFEKLNPDDEDHEDIQTKCDWLFAGYQYFMNKSSDFDKYEWLWKAPIK
jgi:hypothetical protein